MHRPLPSERIAASSDGPVIQALWDAGNIGYVATIGIGFATYVGATSVVALATGALPRWLGAAGAVLAVYCFVVAIIASFTETGAFSASDGVLGLIAFLAFLVWLLVTSIVMVADAEEEASA